MAMQRKKKSFKRRNDDGPNLEFFTGLYEGTGKVLFRAVLEIDRAKEALKNAAKATAVEGKISIVILEASKGDADAWAAFSGMPEPEERNSGKKQKKIAFDEGDEEEGDTDETSESLSDDDEW